MILSKYLISQVTPWCIHHWHGPTWWQSLPCTPTSSTTRISQDSLLSDRTSSGKNEGGPLTWTTNLLQPWIHTKHFLFFLSMNAVYFLQPPSGQSGHCCARQLLSVLAHQPTKGHQQRRIQRQLRLETGRRPIDCVDTKHLTFHFTV